MREVGDFKLFAIQIKFIVLAIILLKYNNNGLLIHI
jgi:hypothetical protein